MGRESSAFRIIVSHAVGLLHCEQGTDIDTVSFNKIFKLEILLGVFSQLHIIEYARKEDGPHLLSNPSPTV